MSTPSIDRRISVAPMLDWTDKHCRYFHRLISQHTVLYTEMVTTGAIIFGKGDYLGFNAAEQPVALQLGGSDPVDMTRCAIKAQEYGYDEVNINVGCPSDRVQNGRFGACLMAEPQTVADCVSAMQAQVDIPITVKSRIGIDDMDEYEDLSAFIEQVADAGCDTFIVHARKAWLQGLSPKQNREVPPLIYERVYQLKAEFPHLHVSINGGVTTLAEAQHHLSYVDGVMIGREAYSNPYILSEVDHLIYEDNQTVLTRIEIVKRMHSYIVEQLAAPNQFGQGTKVWHIVRHMLGLFQGQPGGRVWRRYLSENAVGRNTSPDVLFAALDALLETQAASQAYLDSKVD